MTATFFVVGTHYSQSSKKLQRQVTYEEGVRFARKLPGGIYMETDIEDQLGIFLTMRRLIN